MTKTMRFICAGLAALACFVLIAACGGGGGGPVYIIPPDTTLTPGTSFAVLTSPADGLHVDQSVSFRVRADGYFSQHAGSAGHFGIVTRADLAQRSAAILGHGVIFGDAGDVSRSTQIESWANTATPPNYLFPQAGSPVLLDGVDYDVVLTTHVSTDRSVQWVRYTLSAGGVLLWDSGQVPDPNHVFDPAKNGVWVGQVFANPLAGPWAVTFSKITIALD